ncbi:MAG: hypothetical protein EPN37_18255 [Chitinophagaceae bacterium]|nr:MAG: hypothetical protein EPN37_18255 [Chitinophagaceae bacterium]
MRKLKPWLLKAAWLLLTLSCSRYGQGQMKIGNHPSQIDKASVLELESERQGLLLTRISDTSAMTNLNPPDGMIIYSTQDSVIYIRSHAVWKKLLTSSALAGQGWALTGNNGTDSSAHFLGTNDIMGLRIGTNNIPAIIISREGIVHIMDSLSVAGNTNFEKPVNMRDDLGVEKTLFIGDSVTLNTVREALPEDNSILVISTDGIIRKTSIESLINHSPTAGNLSFHLKMDTVALSQDQHGPWIDSLSQKMDSVIILNIPDAAIAVRGLVSDSTQTFGGIKTFRDSLGVGLNGVPNSSFQISGNMSTATKIINTGSGYDMTDPANANIISLIIDVTNLTGEFTVKLPVAASDINGRTYTIGKTGKSDQAQIDDYLNIVLSGTDTFEDGETAFNIYNNFTKVTFLAQDGKWHILR